jgi:hypothetical protein
VAAPFHETMESITDADCIMEYQKEIKNYKEVQKYNNCQALSTAE